MLLLAVRAGSHLYGSNHDESDKDYFYVTSTAHENRLHKKSKVVKHMVGRIDVTCMDLSTFARQAFDGVPQALEAMYAPESAVLVDRLSAYRQGFYGPLPAMRDRYRRAIKNMAGDGDTVKRKFHGLRLAYNFQEATQTGGRFNPRLPADIIAEFKYYAQLDDYREYRLFLESQSDQLFS